MTNEIALAEYFNQWMMAFKKPAVESVTYIKYQNTYDHILAYFGKIKLKSITRHQYQLVLNEFAKTHAKRTTAGFHKQIRASIIDAVDDGILSTDFTRKAIVTGCEKKKQKEKFLSYEEWQSLVVYTSNHSKENANNFIIYLSAVTGLRYSEVLGLTVADINLKQHLLTVNKTWDYKYHTGFKRTKNSSSVRTIDIDKQTVKIIRSVFSSRKFKLPDQMICIDKNGKLPVSATINRYLENLCHKLAIPIISFHGLRHTHASILLFKGVNILSVSKRLGHKDVTTTQSVYLHIIKEMEERETTLIMRIMNQAMK